MLWSQNWHKSLSGSIESLSSKQGTEIKDVYSVVAEEQAKAAELQAAGKIGAIHLATISRGTVGCLVGHRCVSTFGAG